MTKFGSYTVRDRRGPQPEEPKPACRVCGAPQQHTEKYNQPTMDCIKYLRSQIVALEKQLPKSQRA